MLATAMKCKMVYGAFMLLTMMQKQKDIILQAIPKFLIVYRFSVISY
jgi:hypothetical protein